MATYAFDHDGTLFHLPPETERQPDYYRDAREVAKLKPNWAAIRVAQKLRANGHEIHIVTGRELAIRNAIQANLARHGLNVDGWHMVEEFTGYEDLARFKAAVLRALAPAWMVGDHEVDELAAKEAGVTFHHVRDILRAGYETLAEPTLVSPN